MSTTRDYVPAPESRPTRAYRSPRRRLQAAQTRTAILEVAADLFSKHGWVGTSMRDIARTAGVSVETIYATIGSKATVLIATLDVSVTGDDAPTPLAERPEFAALGLGLTLRDRAQVGAHLTGAINARRSRLDSALQQGAAVEEDLAEVLATGERNRRDDVSAGVRLVVRRSASDVECDELWALMSTAVYGLLVRDCGWSQDQYENWLADRIEEVFSRPA